MRLSEQEVLFLEGAEDFDIHEANTVTATQVKDIGASGSITLRSDDVVKAINNYWRHKQSNLDKDVHLRFLTTAAPGREKAAIFGEIGKGIDYWTLSARDERIDLTPIKDFLTDLSIEEPLKDFLRNSDDASIRNQLIRKISWDTGSKSLEALTADIKDRLIYHGLSKGVDSYQSEKALGNLLGEVAALLSSKSERILTFVDFCRAFDTATMESMPRGEAVKLRLMAAQFQQVPHETICSSLSLIAQAAPVMGDPLPLVRGAVHREKLVDDISVILQHRRVIFLRGSTGLGKTSLARLLIDKLGDRWAWAGFRGRDPILIADQLRRAAFEIKVRNSGSRIVLDDLDLGSVARYEKEFLSLAFSVANIEGFVIITGPSPCPPDLIDKLWLSEECNQSVPYFNEQDIASITRIHGLKDEPRIEILSRILLATTGGHPQLVHARVRYLQQKNWPVDPTSLILTEDLDKERDVSRRRLIDDIPSEGIRSLAYRLSLMVEPFTKKLAIELSQIPPSISLPGEAFDILVGPWIEQLAEDKFRVSPLLQNAGTNALTLDETQAVHKTTALSILRRKRVSPAEVGTGLMHALLAKSEEALVGLARGIMLADPDESRAMGDVVFWFKSMALKPGEHLFESNLTLDFLLRMAQYRIAAAGPHTENALIIMNRTFELLHQPESGPMREINTILAYSTFLMGYRVPIPPRSSIQMLSDLMDLSETNQTLAEIVGNFREKSKNWKSLAGYSPVQSLFYFELARISGLDSLHELLGALDSLSVEKRSQLLPVIRDDEIAFADMLVDTAWWRDVSNNRLEVDKAISILRRTVELGRIWKVPQLVRAAYVALSVILDEYGQDSSAALSILDEAAAEEGGESARILYQRGKVLLNLKDDSLALKYIERALTEITLSDVEKMFACRTAGITAGRSKDWGEAERFFLMGTGVPEQNSHLHNMAVGLKADAAFARWKQGRATEALSLYAEVLEGLESVPIDKDLKSRHLHATVRHCLAWISVAGQKSTDTDMAEPPPGVCSNQEPLEGIRDIEIKDLATAWGLLGVIDKQFGTGLGITQQAVRKSEGKLPFIIRLRGRLAEYEAFWNGDDVTEAVPVIIGMIEGITCKRHIETSDIDVWQAGDIPPLTKEYWADPSNGERFPLFLLAAGVLATSRSPQTSLPTKRWRNDLKEAGIQGTEIDRFLDLVEGKEVEEANGLVEQAALALHRIREMSSSPQELFVYHFRLLNALTPGDWGLYAGDALAELVSRQWFYVTENQRFALRSPSLYCPILEESCKGSNLKGYVKVASILKNASVAADVNVAESGMMFLSRVMESH